MFFFSKLKKPYNFYLFYQQILSINIKKNNIVQYVTTNLQNPNLTLKITSKNNLPKTKNLFIKKFNNLFQNKNYQKTTKITTNTPKINYYQTSIFINKNNF